MRPPEAVVFDLGKVLLDFDYDQAAARLAPLTHWSAQQLKRYVLDTDLLLRYETGLVSTDEFYGEFCSAGTLKCTIDVFAELFGDIFTPTQEMIALQQQLRAAGVPTYILSNTNELAIRFIRRTYPFFSGFTDYVFSFEHSSMKPDRRIYEVLEAKAGKRGAQLLYLDDRPENIAAGQSRGWRTILHENPPDSVRQVRALLEPREFNVQKQGVNTALVASPDQQGLDRGI